MVVTLRTPTSLSAVWHDRTAVPSRWTVHAPHMPMPQPYFVPVSCNKSRKAHNKGISPSASMVRLEPFTSRENCAIFDPPCKVLFLNPSRATTLQGKLMFLQPESRESQRRNS